MHRHAQGEAMPFAWKCARKCQKKVLRIIGIAALGVIGRASVDAAPFHGCTFYQPRLVGAAFAGGSPWSGCADFSAARGRAGCTKTKGPCPACVTYAGDHLQLWLPDYLIEVTEHFGRSVFADAPDGAVLKTHIKRGELNWISSLPVPTTRQFSRGINSTSARQNLWHARILTVPYGSLATTFSPLASSIGSGMPTCYTALSEFFPGQWNTNLADGPFAAAWAPIGVPLCLLPFGATSMAALDAAKGTLTALSGMSTGTSTGGDTTCANPVSTKEASAKNLNPGSDALAPLTKGPGEIARTLCMGSWGNLLPRTGWISSEDPTMAALQASYRFQSAAADFHSNGEVRMRDDDKWQIVWPPVTPPTCFRPGEQIGLTVLPKLEDPISKGKDEATASSPKRGQFYLIAVWRKRTTCEEPFETVGGWSAAHKLHLAKNQAACAAFASPGGVP